MIGNPNNARREAVRKAQLKPPLPVTTAAFLAPVKCAGCGCSPGKYCRNV